MSGRWMRNSFIYLLIAVAVMAIFFTLFSEPLGGSQEVPVSQVISMAARGQIELIEIDGEKLDVTTTSGETLTSRKEEGSSIFTVLVDNGVSSSTTAGIAIEILPDRCRTASPSGVCRPTGLITFKGYRSKDDEGSVLESGMDRFIRKPVEFDKIFAVIEEMTARWWRPARSGTRNRCWRPCALMRQRR